jgi:mRNA interferase RelE/StbE
MFQIIVERSAEKELKRIASEVRPKLAGAIRALAEDPRPPGCGKLVGSENDWRIRIGSYRVIDEIRTVQSKTAVPQRSAGFLIGPRDLFRQCPRLQGLIQ